MVEKQARKEESKVTCEAQRGAQVDQEEEGGGGGRVVERDREQQQQCDQAASLVLLRRWLRLSCSLALPWRLGRVLDAPLWEFTCCGHSVGKVGDRPGQSICCIRMSGQEE